MTYAGILFVHSYSVNARIGLQLGDFQKTNKVASQVSKSRKRKISCNSNLEKCRSSVGGEQFAHKKISEPSYTRNAKAI